MANDMEVGLDKEGLEVLAELEKEGFEIAGRSKPEDKPAEPAKPAEAEKPKEPEKPADQEPKKPDEQKPADENKEPDKKPALDRKVQHVPLPKYLDLETKHKQALEKITELSKPGAKPNEQTVDQAVDAVKILVDKFGYEEEEAKKLAEVIKAITPGQTLTAEQQQALADVETMKAEAKQRLEGIKDKEDLLAFSEDFTNSVLKDFPHLADYKDQIKQMAYSEMYAKTPLRAIALAFMDAEGIAQKPVDVKTSERGGGGTGGTGGDTVDFNNLTEDQFSKLTPDQQEKFFDFQEQKEKDARGALKPIR